MSFARSAAHLCAVFFAVLVFETAVQATETKTYTYDALGRLVGQVADGTVNDNDARTYCYDLAGNRTRVTSDETGVLSAVSCPAPVYTTANLWIDDATVTEGGTLSFTITRSGNTAGTASVSYATSNDTAVAPGDYTAASGSVSFAAGQTSKTVSVTTVDDALFEASEKVTVTLSNPVGGALVDASATGTIDDNDQALAIYLWIAPAEAVEGSPLSFVVTRTGNISAASTVGYYTTNGTAFAGYDYTAVSNGTLSFAAGQASKAITISTINDTEGEFYEDMYVVLTNPSPNSFMNVDYNLGTIVDNELNAILSIGDATVTEGGTLAFVVTRSGKTNSAASADYATVNGTAVAPGDYTSVSGTVSFAAGETSKTISVATVDDTAVESTETLTVSMPTRSMGAYIADGSATGTINDNDVAPATLSISDATVTEGGTLSFTVTRGGNTAIAASASYATANGTATAGSDYTAASGTVSFAAGQTSKTISVSTIDDAVVESAETLTVNLSGPSANVTLSDGSGAGTINDNDSTLAIGNASVTEGGVLSFTVTRTGTTTIAVSASYATANGTATAGSDYTAASGTVSFAANQTSATITVNTINDTAVESAETLTVTLSSPSSGATITTATGTGTINDNDSGLAIGNASVTEGGTLSFTVTRSGVTTTAVSASYATANGTATAGSDYTAASGTVSFAAGETSKTISVATVDDTAVESTETLTVTLSSPSGATIITATGTGTINDNDVAPATLSIGDASVTEGGTLSFTVTRGGNTAIAASASYATANGTATAGSDYTAASGTVSFAAGETSKTISVATTDDAVVESAETLTVNLSGPSANVTLSDGSATGTINDNDVAPATLSISDATVTEGGTLSFTVTRGGNTAIAASASYATANGTATAGSDYTAASGTVSFAAGQTSKTISVSTIDDAVVESAETLTVNLSGPSANVTLSDGSGAGTINDNDVAPSTIILTTTGAPLNMGVLPAHSGAYGCQGGSQFGTSYQVCFAIGVGQVYQYTTGSTPNYTFAPGYSLTANGELQVLPAYYGTAQ